MKEDGSSRESRVENLLGGNGGIQWKGYFRVPLDEFLKLDWGYGQGLDPCDMVPNPCHMYKDMSLCTCWYVEDFMGG